MLVQQALLRLFLDAGVIIDGCLNPWGSCKGLLILATLRSNFRIVLAEPIREEVERNILNKTGNLPPDEAATVRQGYEGWVQRVRIERVPWPSAEKMLAWRHLLPLVRHVNDFPAVVAACLAQPDHVLSTNEKHWNRQLATRSGLRIETPVEFLLSLRP